MRHLTKKDIFDRVGPARRRPVLMNEGGGPGGGGGGTPAPGTITLDAVEVKQLVENVKVFSGDLKTVEKRVKASEDKSETVLVTVKKLEEWIREAEGKANKAGSPAGADFRKTIEAIPELQRKGIELRMRHGQKEEVAVKRAAYDAWMKSALRLLNPYEKSGVKQAAEKAMEAIAVAFGDAESEVRDNIAKANIVEGTGNVGGFLVPTPLEAEVLRVIEDAGQVRSLARKIVMIRFQHLIPNLASNVTVAIVNEAAVIPDSIPATPFGQLTLAAKMIAGLATISMQEVQDSAVGIFELVTTLLGEQYGLFEDSQSLEGSGAGSNFTGLVAAAGTNSVTNGANGTTITGTFYPQLVAQKWKARKASTRRGAAWFMAPEVAQKIEAMVDSQNRPIWSIPIAGATGMFANPGELAGILLGYPAYANTQIAVNRTVGTSTDCSNIYFGPFGHGMIFGDLLGLTFGVSEHVNWTSAMLSLRMLKRTGILVGVPADFTVQSGVRIS